MAAVDWDPDRARGLATNPAAPVELLLRLATGPSTRIRQLLATRPATPAAVLRVLAEDSDPEIRAEVARWPRSWLDWPSFRRLTPSPLPAEVYRRLAADAVPAVRAAVGRNPRAPEDIRAGLADDPDPEVRRSAALVRLPTNVIHRLIGDPEPAVRRAALKTAAVHAPLATVPEQLVEQFLEDSDTDALRLVELTPALLERLWARPKLRFWLARNPSLPADRMPAMLDEASLRIGLAGNPRLPPALIEELLASDEIAVQAALAARVDLPDGLRQRVRCRDDDPLPAVSLQPEHADLRVRLSYVDHPNVAYRRALALATDLPADAVERLARDPDFAVRLMICERYPEAPPATVAEVVDRWIGHTHFDLLGHPSLPAEAVSRYAGSDHSTEREVIAARPDLPVDLVFRLLGDPVMAVRRAAAANPNLPVERIRDLLTDRDVWLREGAASNPALPVADMRSITWQP